jgi:hypothetical protein
VSEEIVPVSQEEPERGMQLLCGLPRMPASLAFIRSLEKPIYKGPLVTHTAFHPRPSIYLQIHTLTKVEVVVSLHEAG